MVNKCVAAGCSNTSSSSITLGSFHIISTNFLTWPSQIWTKLGIRVASLDICSPMKFERHQLYGFSNTEVQNIGFFAIFNVPQTVSAPITWLFFITLKNGLHYLKAQRMSFHVIYYMASFAELANWPHLLISWPLIFQKVKLLFFYHFLWILTGLSPISCKSFILGLAWDY